MDESLLYDLIASRLLYKYRDKLEKDRDGIEYKWTQEAREKLEKTFNEEQLKLIDNYVNNLRLYEDYINYLVDIKLLNCGVKIGMELQQAFDEDMD